MATTPDPSLPSLPPRPAIADGPVTAQADDPEFDTFDAAESVATDFAESLEHAQQPEVDAEAALQTPAAAEHTEHDQETVTSDADGVVDSDNRVVAAPETTEDDGGNAGMSGTRPAASSASETPSAAASATAPDRPTSASTDSAAPAMGSINVGPAATQTLVRPAAPWMSAALSQLTHPSFARQQATNSVTETKASATASHAPSANAIPSPVASTSVDAASMQSTTTLLRDVQVNSQAASAVPRVTFMKSRNDMTSSPSASPQADEPDSAHTGDEAPAAPATQTNNRSATARAIEARLSVESDSAYGDSSAAARQIPAAARAAALEQAIRLENATGQPVQAIVDANAESPRATASSSASGGVVLRSAHADANSIMSLVPSDADAPADSFASQAIRGLSAMLNQRGGAMTLRLDPPELGVLRVHMTIVGGNVSAEFTAGSQQTQALLDRHIATLRQSLESQGLNVERLTVHAAPSSGAANSASRQDADAGSQQHQSWNQQHDAGGSESRGRRDHQQSEWLLPPSFDAGAFSFESLLESDEVLATAAGGYAP